MVTLEARTLRGGSEVAVENWVQVATLLTGGIGPPVFRPCMMERAEGADGMGDSAPLLDMTQVAAVSALGNWGGRTRFFDLAGTTAEV